MSAPTKAAVFADAAEAAGWTVERTKLPHGGRRVTAQRGAEVVELSWVRNDAGTLVYESGWYRARNDAGTLAAQPITGPAQARRLLASYPAASGARLPFDVDAASDAEVLAAVAGKRVTWRNRLTGNTDTVRVPRGGVHLRLEHGHDGHRTLTFTGPAGWRSMSLATITEVRA